MDASQVGEEEKRVSRMNEHTSTHLGGAHASSPVTRVYAKSAYIRKKRRTTSLARQASQRTFLFPFINPSLGLGKMPAIIFPSHVTHWDIFFARPREVLICGQEEWASREKGKLFSRRKHFLSRDKNLRIPRRSGQEEDIIRSWERKVRLIAKMEEEK